MDSLTVTEYNNVRVLTTHQIAEAYETNSDIISRNFANNKDRYKEGKHYICLKGNELKDAKASGKIYGLPQNANKFYLWTEKGCLLHAKSLNTDKAWEVYDRLVDTYFHIKENKNPLDSLSTELKAVIVVDKRVTQVEERIEKLENNMTVTHEMLQTIKNRVNKKVITVLGGHESNAYQDKHLRGKVYSRFNRDYCDYFRINARANTLASKFEGALSYIDMWTPDTNLMIQIKNSNAQLNLEVV